MIGHTSPGPITAPHSISLSTDCHFLYRTNSVANRPPLKMAAQMHLIAHSSLLHLPTQSPIRQHQLTSTSSISPYPILTHSTTWKTQLGFTKGISAAAVVSSADAPVVFSEPITSQTGVVQVDFGGGDDGGGNSGKGYGGGGGGGGGSDEDGGEGEDDEVVKKVGMSMSQKLTLGYAALIGLGGLMGYLKSGSLKSLAAGGISASLLLFVYSQLPVRPALASAIGLGLSAALLVVMGSRFKKSGKVFPAGVVSLVSFIMTGGYFHGLIRGH